MKTTKQLFLLLTLLLLLCSSFQFKYKVFREKPLEGYFLLADKPDLKYFTWRRWLAGDFQSEMQKRVEDHIGFRNDLCRVRNQVDFSLFNIVNARGFIAGKNGYLYEEDYIHEYTGKYFIGTKTLDKKMIRLKNVYDSLKARNIELIVVFEPGKASILPEYIPSRFKSQQRTLSNYEYILKKAGELGLPYLDLNRYFLQLKDKVDYPLFHKYGMHWSLYGVSFAMDTLVKYIEKRCQTNLQEIRINGMEFSDTARASDNDIGEMLNVIFPLAPTLAAYPKVSIEEDPARRNLKVLTIADSYYLTLVSDMSRTVFKENVYWYYNNRLYPYHNQVPAQWIDKTKLVEQYSGFNVILLMISEINLHYGFWNFADEAYLAFHPEVRDDYIYKIENNIRNERSWFQFMVKKARQQNCSLEEMIRRDAQYLSHADYNNQKDKTASDSINEIIYIMESNQEWLSTVSDKAKKENIPLDSMKLSEARYLYRKSLQKN